MTKEQWQKELNDEISTFLENVLNKVNDNFNKLWQASIDELNLKKDGLQKQIGDLLSQKEIVSKKVEEISLMLKNKQNELRKLNASIKELNEKEAEKIKALQDLISREKRVTTLEKQLAEKEQKIKNELDEINIKKKLIEDKEKSLKRIYNSL